MKKVVHMLSTNPTANGKTKIHISNGATPTYAKNDTSINFDS